MPVSTGQEILVRSGISCRGSRSWGRWGITHGLLNELASRPWLSAWPATRAPMDSREIKVYGLIIAAAEKELPLAEAHLAKEQAILLEKMDVIPAPNAFNQGISRAAAL